MTNKEDILIHEIIKVIIKARKEKTTTIESNTPESGERESTILESTVYLKDTYKNKIKSIIEQELNIVDEVFIGEKIRAMESINSDNIDQKKKLLSVRTYLLDKLERDINKINYNYDKFLSTELNKKGQTKRNRHIKENDFLSNIDILLYKNLESLYGIKESKYIKDIVELEALHDEILKTTNNFECPICQYKVVDLINNDHFLPKSKFPTLSISRNNFLLTCWKCNNLKDGNIPELPVFELNHIDNTFIDRYVNITVDFDNLNTLPSVNISVKEGISESENKKITNILNLYSIHKRYTNKRVSNYCDKVINEIIKNTKEEVKDKKNRNIHYNIKDIFEAQRNDMFNRIEHDKSYKNYLKAYIMSHFDEAEDFHLYDIYMYSNEL